MSRIVRNDVMGIGPVAQAIDFIRDALGAIVTVEEDTADEKLYAVLYFDEKVHGEKECENIHEVINIILETAGLAMGDDVPADEDEDEEGDMEAEEECSGQEDEVFWGVNMEIPGGFFSLSCEIHGEEDEEPIALFYLQRDDDVLFGKHFLLAMDAEELQNTTCGDVVEDALRSGEFLEMLNDEEELYMDSDGNICVRHNPEIRRA